MTASATTEATSHRSPLDEERTALLTALATARSALTATVEGLSDEQAGTRPTVSALCPGGLVKHVAAMEESWLRFVTEGPSAMRYDLPDGVTWADMAAGTAREIPQWAIEHGEGFRMLPGETLAGVLADYERVAGRTEEIIASVPDLSAAHPLPAAPWNPPGARRSVRGVLLHLISETAQHAGHGDLLRESLDGRTAS
ncbi:DinB family protein [Streptomyces carpaticus]|uniref:DinB family protein n=1 Tax=Streptomyces TaxID=1883 RepID=UPI0021FC2F19|nr:DinB family protein [Streptomyces carpaticus]